MNYKRALATLALAGSLAFGGNALAQEGGLEGKLGGNQPRQEQVQKDYTEAQARAILADPQKFQAEYESREKAQGMRLGFKPEDLGDQLLDEVRGENDFLRQLVVTYASNDNSAFIASNAIERMTAGDDAYFKRTFDGTNDYHIKTAALRQMSDSAKVPIITAGLQHYGVVEREERTMSTPESRSFYVARDALTSVNDRAFLEATAKRTDIGEYAVGLVRERLAELKPKK